MNQDSEHSPNDGAEGHGIFAGRDGKDIICGGGLLVLGAATAIYSYMGLPLGTYFQIGSRFLPFVMGILMAGFGGLILLPALVRVGPTPVVEWRPFLTILGSVLAFGLTIERLGLIPAIFALTMVATLADGKLSLVNRMILAAVLAVMAVLIFFFALDVRLTLLTWNW